MLYAKRIEAARRMTPAQRWKETERLMYLEWQRLLRLPFEERQRRIDVLSGEDSPPRPPRPRCRKRP